MRKSRLLKLLGTTEESQYRSESLAKASEEELSLADKFLKYDVAEIKDLCKQFLALISGLLVFSVTFGDRIVNVRSSSSLAKQFLVCSWFLLLISIILVGVSLWGIFVAGHWATHRPDALSARDRLRNAVTVTLNSSGVSFVIGLVLLILSGLQGLGFL